MSRTARGGVMHECGHTARTMTYALLAISVLALLAYFVLSENDAPADTHTDSMEPRPTQRIPPFDQRAARRANPKKRRSAPAHPRRRASSPYASRIFEGTSSRATFSRPLRITAFAGPRARGASCSRFRSRSARHGCCAGTRPTASGPPRRTLSFSTSNRART